MTLQVGTRLGPYEVLSPRGAGGMGEVYRAHDSKLGRDVALKVLPQDLADDADRLARFRREAQVLASLNHSNIAAIYGFEDSGDYHALVMELVEGLTLAEVLANRNSKSETRNSKFENGSEFRVSNFEFRISSLDLLPIARQIADGLEYAHEKGVIHRDLKPANVKITPDGAVKILDFGLAKAFNPQNSGLSLNQSNSPTLTVAATQPGTVLGTAAYMSPEQARGRAVDRRADIWAFGCVLFEMLSGQKVFEGETVSDTLAAVLRADPDWKALPTATPAPARNLLRRCLIKDPKQRLRDIGDARIAIEETLSNHRGSGPAPALPGEAPKPPQKPALTDAKGTARRHHTLTSGFVGVLALIVGIVAGWWASARRNPPSPNWSAQMLGGPSVARARRISPDGHTLAFLAMVDGMTQVAVMDPDSGDWTLLTKDRSRGYITELNWSPDGSKIYFDRFLSVPQGIYTVSRFGGEEHPVLDEAIGPEPLPDGSLIVIRVNNDRNYQLYRFWPEDGRLEALDALATGWGGISEMRATHDGKASCFLGRRLNRTSETRPLTCTLSILPWERRGVLHPTSICTCPHHSIYFPSRLQATISRSLLKPKPEISTGSSPFRGTVLRRSEPFFL